MNMLTPLSGLRGYFTNSQHGQTALSSSISGKPNGDVPLWSHTLFVPVYVGIASAILFSLHLFLLSKRCKRALRRVFTPSIEREEIIDVPIPTAESVGFLSRVGLHVNRFGGWTIYCFKWARLLCSIGLLGISVATIIIESATPSGFDGAGTVKRANEQQSSPRVPLSIQIAHCILYAYASLLGIVSISSHRAANSASRHLNLLLLASFVVYAYRDLYPSITFELLPKDLQEGPVLWAKIALLGFSSIFIPLLIPREYVPVDLNNPMVEPTPEQTASIMALMIHSYLDPIIYLGNKVPQLSTDQLPPLADYDHAEYLRERNFPYLDIFSGAKRRHLFFALLQTFRTEYCILSLMIIVHVVVGFASPIGIYKLLDFIETNGEGAHIKPWFWILWIFLGPNLSTISIQWYIYIATRTLVRAESLIIQLVFAHSLRIRMKAEATSRSENSPKIVDISTPGSPSDSSFGDESTLHSATATETETEHSRGETLLASTASDSSSILKDDKNKSRSDESSGESSASNLVGKINNLVTSDLANITASRDFLFGVLYMPLQVSLCVWFLYRILGWSAFVGLATILILFPIPGYVMKVIQSVQVQTLKRMDSRVQTITEILSVLRMVKLFGWENKMHDKVSVKRGKELRFIRLRKILDMINGNINYVIPVLVMISTFSTYTLAMHQSLNASKVFSSMVVFDMLRENLHMIFYTVSEALSGKVSLDRVNDFLHKAELLDRHTSKDVNLFSEHQQGSKDVIGFNNATFAWSADADGTLTPSKRSFLLRIEDELVFQQGVINLICGPTGSGKTSLLMALLGELHFLPSGPDSWFHLPRESVAYAAQESWVLNQTIKDNILFGCPYNEERYKKVLYQCALERDLTLFEAGDMTEVGEKGLTLSGGQKARITLARAVYSSKQILLLDDVLAALDVHTSKWIVEKCLSGDMIQGRTVLLVTHNVTLIRPIAQMVVSVGVDGNIISRGSAAEALDNNEALALEVDGFDEALQKAQSEVDPQSETADAVKKSDGKLILAEETGEGHVGWPALRLYFLGMGGSHSFIFFASVVAGLLLTEIINTGQTWFLGYFASQYDNREPKDVDVSYYLTIYSLFLLVAVVVYCVSNLNYIWGTIRASRSIHDRLVESILGTTLRWLDTTPTSRIITRCTQDIRAVDGPVAQQLWFVSEMTVVMVVKFVAVIISAPIFILPGAMVATLGIWCGQVYIKAQLSVKREMSVAKAPVLGHFGAAIAGLTSIRAYNAEASFISQQFMLINRYTRSGRTFYNLNRWVGIRIDALGSLFAAALGSYLVYGQHRSSSNVGFTLTMAVGFSSMILWWIRCLNEFEVHGNSLERIQEYVQIEQEPKSTLDGTPPAAWPRSGNLRAEKLCARYSLDGPKVLQDISFDLKSGEHIGVVGRTGSGKSSLTLALLRCIFVEGAVYYDGIPTTDLNLDALRSNITIIPQVPELLSGTLRENLDPFDSFDDATLNDALRSAGLFALQSDMNEGRITLDSEISGGGGNLSVGQRQILALARAIIRGSHLLILDEATSAIDYTTDSIIQSSLRNELNKDCTLITIAHRLQTVFDFDRIMVLDAGRLVEFDTPLNLLNNESSHLRALVNESPDKSLLWEMAKSSSRSNHD